MRKCLYNTNNHLTKIEIDQFFMFSQEIGVKPSNSITHITDSDRGKLGKVIRTKYGENMKSREKS